MSLTKSITNEWKGFFLIVLAASLWGVSGTAAKHLMNHDISPFTLVELRLFLSFSLLFLYLAVVNRRLLKITFADLPFFVIFGGGGVGMLQFTYLFTINETNVATAVFLQYLAPVLIVLYGILFLRDKPDLYKVLALILAVCGGFLIVKGNPAGGISISPAGLAGGLASATALAFYTVYGKGGLSRFHHWTMLVYGFAAGALLWSLYIPPWRALSGYSAQTWLYLLYFAVLGTILPFGFYFKGLGCLNAAKTGIISTLEPVIAAAVAWLVLHEALLPLQVLGGGMVCVAVILVQTASRNGQKKTAPVEAAVWK